MASFGAEISADRSSNHELTPVIRAAIISALEIKKLPTELAKEFNVSRSTIYNTQKNYLLRKSLETKHRSGRPEKLSQSAQRYIRQTVRRNLAKLSKS